MGAAALLVRRLDFLDGRRLKRFRLALALAVLLVGWSFYLHIYWDLINWHSPQTRADFFEFLPMRLGLTAVFAAIPLVAAIRPCRATLLCLAGLTLYGTYEMVAAIPTMRAHLGPHGYLRWDLVRASFALLVSLYAAWTIVMSAWLASRREAGRIETNFNG